LTQSVRIAPKAPAGISPCSFSHFLQTLDQKPVVRILRGVFMHIDNDERQDHLLEINLIHRTQTFDEMCRRIDMGAPLANMCK